MAKAENSITVKVIPVILTPDEVRQKIVDVISDWAPIYSDDAEQVAAEILSGVTLVQVEKPEPRVVRELTADHIGSKWRDGDGDLWAFSNGRWVYTVADNDLVWGDRIPNDDFAPYTEVVE
ncbi:hypothetical protein SEA_OHNO789_39 [Mycobacterium phage Ohno789]|nr:hypothetical protein SEA_OHNO789_39 [Mycobacterium phage Ohno789]